MACICGSLPAQTEKTISIHIYDGKTGRPLASSGYQVRVDHQPEIHSNWVTENEDGSGTLVVPKGATLLSIRATYEDSMYLYINCDSTVGGPKAADQWYSISEILTTGIVAPNNCGKPKDAAKIKIAAKPGEFVFLVRKLSTKEQWRE